MFFHYSDKFKVYSLFISVVISITFLYSPPGHSAENKYYYLQVGSFRVASKALKYADKVKKIDKSVIVKGENVSDLGYWYRVYLGPFKAFKKANHKKIELRKKGLFVKGAFVHKKVIPVISNLGQKDNNDGKYLSFVSQKQTDTPRPLKTVPASTDAPVINTYVKAEKPVIKEMVSSRKPDPEKISKANNTPEIETDNTPAMQPDQNKNEMLQQIKPVREQTEKGYGRNIPEGKFALAIRHTYLEIQTEVTDRREITSNGTTVTDQALAISDAKKNEFPTSMNMDTVRIRYGVTDYLEVFADIGAAYDELSNSEIVFGGGGRLNLYSADKGQFAGFYVAFEEEYLGGSLNDDYDAPFGYQWNKNTDWYKLSSKLEAGVVRSQFEIYAGGVYFIYDEDTERTLINPLPAGLTSYVLKDDLEAEYSFGFYGGVGYHFSSTMIFNIEGQIGNQKSILGSFEYRF